MRRAVPLTLILAALSAAPRPARAQPQPLQYDLRVDGAIVVGTWALYGGLELWKDDLAPMKCKFYEPNSFDAWARERLVWGNINQAQAASSAIAFIVVPAGMAAHQLLAARSAGDVNAGWVDLLIVAEATGIAMDVNQILKFTIGRQRPFVH